MATKREEPNISQPHKNNKQKITFKFNDSNEYDHPNIIPPSKFVQLIFNLQGDEELSGKLDPC